MVSSLEINVGSKLKVTGLNQNKKKNEKDSVPTLNAHVMYIFAKFSQYTYI